MLEACVIAFNIIEYKTLYLCSVKKKEKKGEKREKGCNFLSDNRNGLWRRHSSKTRFQLVTAGSFRRRSVDDGTTGIFIIGHRSRNRSGDNFERKRRKVCRANGCHKPFPCFLCGVQLKSSPRKTPSPRRTPSLFCPLSAFLYFPRGPFAALSLALPLRFRKRVLPARIRVAWIATKVPLKKIPEKFRRYVSTKMWNFRLVFVQFLIGNSCLFWWNETVKVITEKAINRLFWTGRIVTKHAHKLTKLQLILHILYYIILYNIPGIWNGNFIFYEKYFRRMRKLFKRHYVAVYSVSCMFKTTSHTYANFLLRLFVTNL